MSKYCTKIWCAKCKQVRSWVTHNSDGFCRFQPYCKTCKTTHQSIDDIHRQAATDLLERALVGEEVDKPKKSRAKKRIPHKRNKLVFKRFWRDEWRCNNCGVFNLSKKRWPNLVPGDRYASSMLIKCRNCTGMFNSNFAGMTHSELRNLYES